MQGEVEREGSRGALECVRSFGTRCFLLYVPNAVSTTAGELAFFGNGPASAMIVVAGGVGMKGIVGRESKLERWG